MLGQGGGTGAARRRFISALASVMIVAFGGGWPGVPGTLVAGAQASAWAVSPSPSTAGLMANELGAVSCPATGNCFAVGYSSTPQGTSVLVETLGAGGWSLMTAPNAPGSYADELEGISCASVSACVAVGYYQQKGGPEQALVETFANGSWAVTPSPDTGAGNNQLAAVSCPAAGACMATGYYETGSTSRALAEELSGASWVLAPAPDASAGDNRLAGVSCASAGHCVGVGYYTNAAGVQRALVESFSGGTWSVTSSPDQGPGLNELSGVSCPSPGTCVFVGTYRTTSGVYQTLIETLAAGSWDVVAPGADANGRNNELDAVSCASPSQCAAVGHYNSNGIAQALTVQLNAGAWAVVPSPDHGTSTNDLNGVSCVPGGPADCAAVGYFYHVISGFSNVVPQALAEEWGGSSWALVAVTDALAPDEALNSVSCPSTGTCVAVGSYYDVNGDRQVLVEDLAGGSWANVTAPGPSATTNILNSVSCSSSASCVAVGDYSNGKTTQALVEQLAAGTWTVSPSPDQGTGYNQLNGVSCGSPGACVAVGFYSQGSQQRALIETLSNGSWALTSSPATTASASYLESVSCASPASCVAVGYEYNGTGRRTLIETLVNGAWAISRSPNDGTGDNLLDGVSCWSPTSCVAVGYYQAGKAHWGLVESLEGANWAVTTVPQPSVTGDYPASVSCTLSGSCVLVGDFVSGPAGSINQTLVEAISTGGWAVVASPSPDAGGDYLGSAWCVALASCVAVGHYDDGAAQPVLVETGPSPVGLAQTTTTLSSSPNPAKVGQKVTYTAEISPPPAGGTVTFANNGAVISGCRSVAVDPTGKAQCSAKYGAPGESLVQAAYSGLTGFSPSTSALYSQAVIRPVPVVPGYWLATRTGRVFGAGSARALGGISTTAVDPVVGISASPRGTGYWLVTANGTVAAFGAAAWHGDLPADGVKASDIVAIAPTANGEGYWLVGRDGGLFAFGNATFHGSVPAVKKQVGDIVGIVTSPGGRGYLLVGSDGGVFAFGATHFYGSLPVIHVAVHNVKAILPSTRGTGYVLVASDGGAFLFGSGVSFHGSLPAEGRRVGDIVGIALTPDDGGYYMAGADGAVYGFGDAKVQPTPEGLTARLPVVAIAGA